MGFLQDLHFALRISVKRPAATLVAVLILALGIGVNVAVFSVVNAAFFKTLPIHEPDRVVTLYVTQEGEAVDYGGHSYPDFTDLREHCVDVIDLCAVEEEVALHVGTTDGAVRINGALVSGNYFSMLGVQPALGRMLTPNDDLAPGGHPVAVVSHRYWRTQFGSDEHIIGREVLINSESFEIVGVAAEGFDGTRQGNVVALWGTMSMFSTFNPQYAAWGDFLTIREISWMEVIGRLRDGATMPQVESLVDTGYQQIAETSPIRTSFRCLALPLGQSTIDPESRQGMSMWLKLLMMAVAAVMLIACSNVASLQLARLNGRRRELAVRLAMGASRWRLARQLLSESLLLALVGAGAGLLSASWFGDALAGLLAQEGTYSAEALSLDVDWRVMTFTIGLAVMATTLFGVGPALLAARRDPLPALKSDRIGGEATGQRFSLQNVLVSGQVAISFVLVISASLLVISLVRLQQVRLGFDPNHVLVASLDFSRQGYDEERGLAACTQLLDDLRAAPGVERATIAAIVPVSGSIWSTNINVPGYDAAEDEVLQMRMNQVDSAYFETMGIPLLSGRHFMPNDDAEAPRVAIINETMARRYWPGEDPVGRSYSIGSEFTDGIEVVGVVADSKYNTFRSESVSFSYFPIAQDYQSSVKLIMKGAGEPFAMLPSLRAAVRRVDPGLPVFEIRSLEQQLGEVLARDRLTAILFGGFGVTALLLVVAGLYGVLSYTVTQRVREIGIRMAIGAERGAVLRQFLWRGVRITGLGLVVGALASVFITRLLSNQLFEVQSADPWAMAGVALTLLIVGLVACWAPARRATRIDPMIALRSE